MIFLHGRVVANDVTIQACDPKTLLSEQGPMPSFSFMPYLLDQMLPPRSLNILCHARSLEQVPVATLEFSQQNEMGSEKESQWGCKVQRLIDDHRCSYHRFFLSYLVRHGKVFERPRERLEGRNRFVSLCRQVLVDPRCSVIKRSPVNQHV